MRKQDKKNDKEKKVLILNGPNINMLGIREPEIYGYEDSQDLGDLCTKEAKLLGFEIDIKQSNHEGVLIDWIQEAENNYKAIIINAGGLAHTSVSIRDALSILHIPIIEVHISNIFRREEFRYNSYISDIAKGMIAGFGIKSYILALHAVGAYVK